MIGRTSSRLARLECHVLFAVILTIAFTASNKLHANEGQNANLTSKPNIILVMADDLGISELSCYGNKVIKTPNIDRIAREGIAFRCAYSGSIVCAPARCSLLTGQHTGQCSVRVNTGGVPLPDRDVTIAEMLKKCGYATGGFGKWALGIENSGGDPLNQGFDEFYGYYHQTHAHNHYPEFLVHNGVAEKLDGNIGTDFDETDGVFLDETNPQSGKKLQYVPYLLMDRAEQFIRRNADRPFFCYIPTTLPHGHFHIPKSDPATAGIDAKPWSYKSKGVAALNQLLDRQMGDLMALLKELDIDDNTIVIFCSDHGAARRLEGELDRSGPFRGAKRSVYEGGLRTPLIVRWPKAIRAGSTSKLPVYLGDLFATFREIVATDPQTDSSIGEMLQDQPQHSISFLPTLVGQPDRQQRHEFLLWDWAGFNPHYRRWNSRRQAIRAGDWKLLRHADDEPWELYNLATDPFESQDLAQQRDDIVQQLENQFKENAQFPPTQLESLVHWRKVPTWETRNPAIRRPAKSMEQVVESTADELKDIAFAEDAILNGVTSKMDSDGNLHLNFAWHLNKGRREKRFIHICDTSGKVLTHGPTDEDLFANQSEEKVVLDYAVIYAKDMRDADSVAVGFFDTQRKSAVVANGDQAKKSRLVVWRKTESGNLEKNTQSKMEATVPGRRNQ